LVAENTENKASGPQTTRMTIREYAPGVYLYRARLDYDSQRADQLPLRRFVVSR
jgi:hypothetical protein